MAEQPVRNYRELILDTYISSTYAHRTDLSAAGVENNAGQHRWQFAAFLPEDKSAPIIDIGCGNGGFLRCCKELGYTDLSGIDASIQQVEFCRERGFAQVERSDAFEYLQRCDRTFAAIAMIDVLEHLPKEQVVEALRHVRRCLRPGGRLIVRVPNMSNPLNIRTRYVDFTHEVGFSKESLQQVLRVAELDIVSVHGAFREHPRLVSRVVFDKLLWRAFVAVYRRTLHLSNEVVRGKNLIAVAERA